MPATSILSLMAKGMPKRGRRAIVLGSAAACASSSRARALIASSLDREIQIAGSSDWAIRANTCSASSVAEIAPLRNALRRDAISRGEPVAIIGMLLEASLARYLKHHWHAT